MNSTRPFVIAVTLLARCFRGHRKEARDATTARDTIRIANKAASCP
jgi:hypothetical protein